MLVRDRSFFMKKGGGGRGAAGIWVHHLKITWPPSAYQFFHMAPLRAVIFLDDPPPSRFYLFSILYYSPTWRYCARYEDEIYNPYTTGSSSVKKEHKSKEREI